MNTAAAYPHEAPSSGPAATLAAQVQAPVPVLTTKRLTLRAPRIEDFPAYAAILMSPRFPHGSGPMTREDVWFDFCNYVAGWLLRGHGLWAVEARADGDLVGFVPLGLEPGDREAELGWMLTETSEGQGLATEAAQAARAHAFEVLKLDRLVSYIHHENPASARVAGRLGATRDASEEKVLNQTCQVWRHLPEVQA